MRDIDEDPSPEDIERFGHDNAHCPDCGAEVWDDAEVCPKCFAYLGGNTAGRTPARWMLLLIITLIILGILGWGWL